MVCAGEGGGTSIAGIETGIGITATDKIWRVFRAFGDIAFAYSYSVILIEIQVRIVAIYSNYSFIQFGSFCLVV